MKRIAIIGPIGAGKSTFAHKLGKMLKREVTYMDREYFLPGWKKRFGPKEWEEHLRDLLTQDEWIFEGGFQRTTELRVNRATTIVFLDIPKWKCLCRAIGRFIKRSALYDKPDGSGEHKDVFLPWWLIKYPKRRILKKLKEVSGEKQVFIIRNDKEKDTVIQNLSKQSAR